MYDTWSVNYPNTWNIFLAENAGLFELAFSIDAILVWTLLRMLSVACETIYYELLNILLIITLQYTKMVEF